MKAITLNASVREETGKKVKKLRKQGLLPASVYGKDVKSKSLALPVKEFMKVYDKAGATGLVELKYGNESQHVLIKNVQIEPLTRGPLHAEFHAVKLTEKIKANVPVELVGESPAVANNVGILLQTLNEVEVEALPIDLPDKIEVDTNKLSDVGQQITVGELAIPEKVVILTDANEIVVKVAAAISEEAKALEAEETAAAEAAAGPEEATEGEKKEEATEAPTPEKDEVKEG